MSGITRALAIAGANLRRTFRDRTALFFVAVLPVIIIIIIGSTFGSGDVAFEIGTVNQDGETELSSQLVDAMEDSPTFAVRTYSDEEDLDRAVRTDAVAAGLVVPAGYDRDLRAGRSATVTLVADPTAESTSAVRSATEAALARQARVVAAARFAAGETGDDLDQMLDSARQLAGSAATVDIEERTLGDAGDRVDNRFAYTAPSNLVLFVFVNSLAAAAALVETRRLGISRRMLATPTSTATIVAGEALGRFALALLQAVLIVAVGALVFDVSWGNPPAAAALVMVFVLVATGAGLLVGTVARTGDQASSIGPPIGIAMGMLGGCMWPLEVVGDTMRAVGHVVPHAWAMDAWSDLIFDGEGIGAVAPELAVLAGWAAALLAVATWRLHRRLRAG